jgi:ABC-type nickel/cobalt efflux system permease component RcnA
MTTLLLLAFLLGMRHALEADHLAAVATLATRSRTRWQTVSQGAAWGLGHTLMLLLAGGVCLLASVAIPARLARGFEMAVGVMLLGLGAEVLWRVRRQNVHIHVHTHADGTRHLHAHSHAPEQEPIAPPAVHSHGGQPHAHHSLLLHSHPHAPGFPRRALLVGLVHGLAGSAALLLLTVTTLSSRWLGFFYILVFGLGSILGMAVLSAVISVPLQGTARALGRTHRVVEVLTGLATVGIGIWVIAGAA